MYTYNEKDQVLTFGEGEEQVKITLPKDKYNALKDLPEVEFIKIAKVIGRVLQRAESEQKARARQEFMTLLAERAKGLRERYLEWLSKFNEETVYLRTQFGIESIKPFGGDTETVRFYALASKLAFAKLAAAYPDIKIRVENQQVEGFFDDPELAKLTVGARELNLQLAGLANALNAELGNPYEKVHVAFDDQGNIVDRSKASEGAQGARGGSTPGRVLAKGFEVDGKVMTSKSACEYLGIPDDKVSTGADGTKYYAKALEPYIKSGRVRRVLGNIM